MNSLVNQTHAATSSCPARPHMPLIKNTPRLQCTIPNPPLKTGHLEPSLETSTLAAMLDMDNKLIGSTPDGDQSNIDHITILERVVCSNFSCCGTQHSDLHALLAHFEGDHVVVLAPNGKRVFPVALHPSSGESTPASSRSSSVSPSLPSSPITPPFSIPSSPSDAKFSISLANHQSGRTVPPVYTPFTPCWPLEPAYSLPDHSEIVIVQEPTFDFSTQPSLLPPLQLEAPATVDSSESEFGDDEANILTDDDVSLSLPVSNLRHDTPQRHSEIPKAIRSTKEKRGGGMFESSAQHTTSSKPSKSRRGVSSSTSHSRRREKMFRCPKEGCVKAYLNPNGLKYHLEKGTCKLEDDDAQSTSEKNPNRLHQLHPGDHPRLLR
ncbi:hypothetical protein CPB83DRAFT_419477 [Crepidotus variabilis]|uniref:C2H2-type domain-containing protein n=1 Tax=Crepidotus variabilis TaxID=179855 RepID=A0A9P6ERN2_9AGAR|nr:hypothetical protein CPB83DRAFT_419477 [Crepidotus variabilis]